MKIYIPLFVEYCILGLMIHLKNIWIIWWIKSIDDIGIVLFKAFWHLA